MRTGLHCDYDCDEQEQEEDNDDDYGHDERNVKINSIKMI